MDTVREKHNMATYTFVCDDYANGKQCYESAKLSSPPTIGDAVYFSEFQDELTVVGREICDGNEFYRCAHGPDEIIMSIIPATGWVIYIGEKDTKRLIKKPIAAWALTKLHSVVAMFSWEEKIHALDAGTNLDLAWALGDHFEILRMCYEPDWNEVTGDHTVWEVLGTDCKEYFEERVT